VSERVRRIGAVLGAAVALVAGLPVAATAAPAPSGSAPAPGSSARASSARASSAPAEPVAMTLQTLEPHDVRPDSTITISALLRNTSANSTGPLILRLRRGTVISTRGELQAADSDQPTTGFAAAPPQALDSGLTPGQTTRVTYQAKVSDLALSSFSGIGVYPLALTVQRADDGTEVGRLATDLPYLQQGISGTKVTLLWPLLDRPHRLTGAPAGSPEVFADDLLARSVAPGGRLNTLLAAAEAVTGKVKLTLVVDPETIEALSRMTDPAGYRVGTGSRTVAGTGAVAAADWLGRLRAIVPKHLLVATPYADPDIVALERGGNAALARFQQPDLDATARVLGVMPSTKVSWPPDGQLTDSALDDVVAQGANAVVLSPNALSGTGAGESGRTPSGVSPLPALSGPAVALVSDPVVQNILQRGGLRTHGFAGGPRIAEQRLLSELAMITAEAPNDTRTIVLAPPRRWDPPAAYARALATDLGSISWLTAVDALQASGSPQVDRGALVYPGAARAREVPPSLISDIGLVQSQVADFRSALSNEDAGTELQPYGDAVRRAGSSAWRSQLPAGQAYVARLLRQIGTLRGAVTLSSPATGDYTLASSDSPLLLTLENKLTVPVSVRLRLTTPAGFTTRDVGLQQIPPKGKRTVKVLASVQRTGTFAVKGQVTTPTGGALGNEITLSVRSTAYGGLALGITGLAFAVLVLAVLYRLYRRWKARGTEPPVAAGSPADRSLT
jgi:hypothetical protein